ncbi:hypothetical protein DID88_000460 [Monilinia fructigena]|uniref:Uncharacterized protein n=1 Tax=Monilinia fructigena TaxID=38457 RepID=A0A395II21_9HELO|nr:hypothetical protein DID88_000460 [Monilinia fructigena]
MAPFSRSSSGKILSSPILAILCSSRKAWYSTRIVLTKDSRRKEASAVAFKPSKNPISGSFPERLYGSDAIALAARFPGDVYPNLKPLLGLKTDNHIIKDYATRHPALQLEAEKTRGTAAFRSGAFAADEQPCKVKDLVIAIPTFYTTEEKRAVLLAADLAGLRVLELISDGLAVGLNYATTRTFPSISEGGKPEYHMVFDMGCWKIQQDYSRSPGLGSSWDRTLGGDALNAVIVDHMMRNLSNLQKRKSANANTQASFEGLYEDVDFKYKISRAEFETLAESHAARIDTIIEKALYLADVEITDLDFYHPSWRCHQNSFVQKELERIAGGSEKIRTNVNADESRRFWCWIQRCRSQPFIQGQGNPKL